MELAPEFVDCGLRLRRLGTGSRLTARSLGTWTQKRNVEIGPAISDVVSSEARDARPQRSAYASSPSSPFNLVFRATSAGDPPGRRSQASNIFLVNRCCVLGSRDSTTNSCNPFGSYLTCSQWRKRSIANPTASYNVRASNSTACSIPSESLNDTRHCFTRKGYHHSPFIRPMSPFPRPPCLRSAGPRLSHVLEYHGLFPLQK